MLKNKIFPLIWLVIILFFFYPIFQGKIPAPLDAIVGLYHPFRDVTWNNYPNGVPFKNFLITDPVRQQIPYRYLAVENLKKGNISVWNPYSFSGTPLSANIQTGLFYPLNILFLFLPFSVAWTVYILISPLFGGLFIYLYLRHIKLSKISCFFGSLVFSFSGFFIAWLEWGNLTHVLMWLPLILLAEEHLLDKINLKWLLVFMLAQLAQLFAGHLQISFYVCVFSLIYFFFRLVSVKKGISVQFLRKNGFLLLALFVIFMIILSLQYLPLFKFINLSARNFDLPDWRISSWFLPWQNLIQLVVPDFFGNPSTLNYWGEWNYGEFISYIGIIPLIFSIYAVLFNREKNTLFFSLTVLVVLILITPNYIARIPYILNLPFIGTAQPTRLLAILTFCLAVLSAVGLDLFLRQTKTKGKQIIIPLAVILSITLLLWIIVFQGFRIFSPGITQSLDFVSKRNLILPTFLILISAFLLIIYRKVNKIFIIYLLLVMTALDLFRFGWKYLSFSNNSWFYPDTKLINYLQKQIKPYRIMTLDRKIFPPNFSAMYKIEDVAGYDPLYLINYAKLVQAWNSGSIDLKPGRFNRIITPDNYNSYITDLLNVKYILSLTEINSPKLILKFQEGETRLYENTAVFPRTFLVEEVKKVSSEVEEITFMNEQKGNLKNIAVSQEEILVDKGGLGEEERADLSFYDENSLLINTLTNKNRLLVVSDINYPSWQAYIDNKKVPIYTVNLAFRGVIVPEGQHRVEFTYEDY